MSATFGARLRAARLAANRSQTELGQRLADAVGSSQPPTQETISRWERNVVPPQRILPIWRRALPLVLGIHPGGGEEDDRVLRRTFIATAAVVGPGAATLSDRPGVIGTDHVAALRGSHEALVALDDSFGGGASVSLAAERLKLARHWIDHNRYTPEMGRQLWAAKGEIEEAMGWGLFDDGHQDQARHHFQEALVASKAAESPQLEVMTLASMSLQQIYLSRPHEAAALLRAAEVIQRSLDGRRLGSVLAVRQARVAAQLGDRQG